MLFKLMLRKFYKSELLSCLPKVGHMINYRKRPIQVLSSDFEARVSASPWDMGFTIQHSSLGVQ